MSNNNILTNINYEDSYDINSYDINSYDINSDDVSTDIKDNSSIDYDSNNMDTDDYDSIINSDDDVDNGSNYIMNDSIKKYKNYIKNYIKTDDMNKLIKYVERCSEEKHISYLIIKSIKYGKMYSLNILNNSVFIDDNIIRTLFRKKNILKKIYKYLYTYKNLSMINLFIYFSNRMYKYDTYPQKIVINLLIYLKNKKSSLYRSLKHLKHTYSYNFYMNILDLKEFIGYDSNLENLNESFELLNFYNLNIIINDNIFELSNTQLLYLFYMKYFTNHKNLEVFNEKLKNRLFNNITTKDTTVYEDSIILEKIYSSIKDLCNAKKVCKELFRSFHIFLLSINNKFAKNYDLNKIKNINIKKLLLYTIIYNICPIPSRLHLRLGTINIDNIVYNLNNLINNTELYDFNLNFIVNVKPTDFFGKIYFLLNNKFESNLEKIIIANIYNSNITNTVEYTDFANNKKNLPKNINLHIKNGRRNMIPPVLDDDSPDDLW